MLLQEFLKLWNRYLWRKIPRGKGGICGQLILVFPV